jgi:flagellar assembly protein FliH
MNNKYYISFTENRSDKMSLNSYEKYQLNDSDDLEETKTSDAIIRNAQIEAEKIVNDAKASADNIIRQAIKQKEEQYNDGFKKGLEEAENVYKEKFEKLNEALSESIKAKKQIIDDSEQQLLQLSIKIAEKILHEKATFNDESIKLFFEKSIEDILKNDFNVICVRLNKYNIENFYPDWEVEKYMLNIKHDARLDNNSCIVETDTGDIDISLFTQLNEVSRKLISVV